MIRLILILIMALSFAGVIVGCGESVSERSANQTTEHRLRSLEDRVTALENGK